MSKHKKFSPTDCSIIFTIGSARITGSVVSYSQAGKLIVHYTSKTRYVHQEELDVKRFTKGMISGLMEVAMSVESDGKKVAQAELGGITVTEYICVFTAPWFVSQTRTITHNKEEPFVVTQQIIDDLIREEVQEFQEHIQSKKSPYNLFSDDSVVSDVHVIRTELNGYQVEQVVGKEASSVSITLYTSLMSQNIVNQVRELIEQTFPH